MSRMSSDISEESKLDECAEGAVSSASNVYVDDVYEKSSPLIVDLSKTAENKAFIEHENEELMSEVRSRKLTEKGRSYQVENLVKSFKSQKTTLVGTLRKTLLLRGSCCEISIWKQEFSKAQVLWNEIGDIHSEIIEIAQDHEMKNVEAIWEQVCREWYDFERDAREEIKYLEQTMLDSGSVSSKGSRKSKLAKSVKSRTSVNTVLSARADKCKLQQEEATLKVKLAYVEHEKALEMEKIRNEQKLEELKLNREIQLNKAKLNVCEKIELEEQSSLVEDLAHIPSESKGEQVRQYLQSLPVTASTSVGNTAVHPQASQAPVLTTTSTPKSTTCGLRASAPSFPTRAVTQTVYAGHYLEHELSYPTQRELPSSETMSPARNESVTTRPFTGPSPIMSAVTTPVYQSVHPRGQGHSIGEGWERVASSLERCMDKLTEANLEQSTVSKQLFVSGHLPKLSISVFNGDPLQCPVWKSAFNALVDSRPLEPDIKLNLLNQHVAGKPKQVVEHYLLIGTEDAYQKARSVLQERYGNCNVVSTAFINQLEKWPKIIPRNASGLESFQTYWIRF